MMLQKRVKIAFLSLTAIAAGFAAGCSSSPDVHAPVAPVAVVNNLATPTNQTSQPNPSIEALNVFGEFDGVERTLAHAYGEAGFQQHTFLDEGYDSDVNVDPTGKWLVFASTRDSGHPNLYLQRVDGMSVIQLTNDEADYAYPTFSPDGKQIAFCSTRGGNWDIYVMDADGKNIVQVTTGPMQHVHPSFSPDGGKLVFSCLGSKSGQWELWTVDLTTGEKRMIGFGLFPTWAPEKDVDRIAFQRARQRGSRWFSLWTLDLVDGEARQITEVAVSSNAAIVAPTWSPDGKKLAFATIAQPTANSNGKAGGQQDIWTVDADGSNRHRVTDGIGMNLSPCWSSDNRIYFISDRCGAECVWSVKYDGVGNNTKVAEKPHSEPIGEAN
jgi:TolB protein